MRVGFIGLGAMGSRTAANLMDRPSLGKAHPHCAMVLVGLMLSDQPVWVNVNTACSLCHMPNDGFTGPSASLNATTVAYPGSVRDAKGDLAPSRYGHRKPQSYMYAPFYPVLHYNPAQQDFY